jgi:quercetin dioxygenase-like cupin family protein
VAEVDAREARAREPTPRLALSRVRLGDGEKVTDEERREIVLLAAEPELAVTWSRYAAGERGPEHHVHRGHTDAFYVLEGELTFAVGPEGQRVRVGAGGFAAVPPNVVHTFRNDGSAEARFLNFHAADGGFAAYLRARGDGADAAWDSFDPPADGGRPASDTVVSRAGEGERVESARRKGLLKGALPDLRVTELALDGRYEGPGLQRGDGRVDAYLEIDGRLLHVRAPGSA